MNKLLTTEYSTLELSGIIEIHMQRMKEDYKVIAINLNLNSFNFLKRIENRQIFA